MWCYSDDDEAEDSGYLRLHNASVNRNKCLTNTGGSSSNAGGSAIADTPSSSYRKTLTDISEGLCRDLTKSAHSYGTMPRIQGCQSSSSRACAATSDDLTNKLLRLSPDQIATQITLGDFPVFKAISPEELTTCGWTKKDKHKLAPNVVLLTKRFNHLSFWVVHETLNAGGVKSRAEVMTHFIKVARRLGYLHNYHSQFAVISSLQSAPIYRLRKTWAALSRKDRNHFDRMAELFSEKNNWEKLRAHVNTLKLPMIPYLGLFLTDIVYIDMAHPHFGGLESEQRQLKMNNLLRVLADYQQSDYTRLPRLPRVQQYLSSIKYIEELQKFVEDDHYKLSVCLEPNTPLGSHSTSKDSLAAECSAPAATTTTSGCGGLGSPVRCHTLGPTRAPHSCPQYQGAPHCKFVPGHRKARSLGTKFRSMSLPRNLHRSEANNPQPQAASIVDRLG
ncbi:Ras guanine-nucleotide exchange factors catalytic domain [Trinorchestia longiramus]|nr:Ras guanine-nucleotide exchange factors catalytic domain [Trinorchestia longiramus]